MQTYLCISGYHPYLEPNFLGPSWDTQDVCAETEGNTIQLINSCFCLCFEIWPISVLFTWRWHKSQHNNSFVFMNIIKLVKREKSAGMRKISLVLVIKTSKQNWKWKRDLQLWTFIVMSMLVKSMPIYCCRFGLHPLLREMDKMRFM